MMILAALLYFLSGVFVWFFLGELALKVDPRCAIIMFGLLITNYITKLIILTGDKNDKK